MVTVVPSTKAKINPADKSCALVHHNTLLMVGPHNWQGCVVRVPDHPDQGVLQHPALGVHAVDAEHSCHLLVQQDADPDALFLGVTLSK